MGPTVSADPYHECLATQLAVLRSDFGLNLEQLPAADRRALDKACSRIRTIEGRERYVECLSARLLAIHDSRVATTPVPVTQTAASLVPVPSPAAATRSQADRSSGISLVLIAALVLATVVVTSRFTWLHFRKHRRTGACAGCGMAVNGGDFCPACRHEAAERLRLEAATRGLPPG